MTVLVTGASGFLGAWTVARLLAGGQRVVASDLGEDRRRLLAVAPEAARAPLDWRRCDVADTGAVAALVADVRPTVILHLAALQIPQCRADPVAGARVNVLGHLNVMEAAREVGARVVYTSSIAAKPRGPAAAPANLYGVFKRADEDIARIYWEDHRLPSFGLRPYIVYGLGRDQGETAAITRAIEAAALGRAYKLPFATRSAFQYAGEVAEILARAAAAKWEGAPVSDLSDEVAETAEVLAAIRRAVPGADVTQDSAWRVPPDTAFDTAPLRDIVGAWPRVSLDEGVARTVAMVRAAAGR